MNQKEKKQNIISIQGNKFTFREDETITITPMKDYRGFEVRSERPDGTSVTMPVVIHHDKPVIKKKNNHPDYAGDKQF